MPRSSRKILKTPFFHVITQGINKSYIFNNPQDIKLYIKEMYKLMQEHQVKVISYCIMNNHAHMLIQTSDVNQMSKYMQRLNIKYSKYYNKKYNRVGYVFRDRYKSEGIFDEKQLYNCIKYIYDNPVKAGICKRPEDYPYSNFKKIPNELIDETYTYIDIDEEKENTYIEEVQQFITKHNISDLKKDKENLEKVVKMLRNKHKLSFRKIATLLDSGREKVRAIYNK